MKVMEILIDSIVCVRYYSELKISHTCKGIYNVSKTSILGEYMGMMHSGAVQRKSSFRLKEVANAFEV